MNCHKIQVCHFIDQRYVACNKTSINTWSCYNRWTRRLSTQKSKHLHNSNNTTCINKQRKRFNFIFDTKLDITHSHVQRVYTVTSGAWSDSVWPLTPGRPLAPSHPVEGAHVFERLVDLLAELVRVGRLARPPAVHAEVHCSGERLAQAHTLHLSMSLICTRCRIKENFFWKLLSREADIIFTLEAACLSLVTEVAKIGARV